MYIRKLKEQNPEAKLDESISVGKFLDELKDETDILVGFTIFLAEEFLKDRKPRMGENEGEDDKASEIVRDT